MEKCMIYELCFVYYDMYIIVMISVMGNLFVF